jgi:hypothetical protein
VLANAWGSGKTLRVFEWIYVPTSEGHPHVLTPELFAQVLPFAGAVLPSPPIRDAPLGGMVFYGMWSKGQ